MFTVSSHASQFRPFFLSFQGSPLLFFQHPFLPLLLSTLSVPLLSSSKLSSRPLCYLSTLFRVPRHFPFHYLRPAFLLVLQRPCYFFTPVYLCSYLCPLPLIDQTPLHWAVFGSTNVNDSTAHMLLDLDINVTAKDKRGRNPTHIAISKGLDSLCGSLVAKGFAGLYYKALLCFRAGSYGAVRRS